MSIYTITLTAEQDAAISSLLSATGSVLTKEQYLQSRAEELANENITQMGNYEASKISEAYKNSNSTTKTQIKTDLGI